MRLVTDVHAGRLTFKRHQALVKELKKVTKEEVIAVFDDFLAVGGKKRRKFASLVNAGKQETRCEEGDANAAPVFGPADIQGVLEKLASAEPAVQEELGGLI